MRSPTRLPSIALLSAAVGAVLAPAVSMAQLEEVIVTAERRETSLQETPISIQAFTAQDLELGGIQQGQDLGIMTPNVVLNPSGGGGSGGGNFYIRGLPGVGVYLDGVWQGDAGLLESDFVELERIEVLRGPQGTLFGRNTNGGAINMVTRKPADEFGARVKLQVGEFNRRDMEFAVDLPFTDKIKTKWMAASLKNDGFLESQVTHRALGDQNDTLLRGDILWEPTDSFSMRLTLDDESKHGTPPRIVRFTNTEHARYLAYNVLAGNPDFLAAVRQVDPAFPNPPKQLPGTQFTPQATETNFPGGRVGKWETRSDTALDGVKRDMQYGTLTLNWQATDHFAIQSITSTWEQTRRNVTDFDGSEFTVTTDDYRNRDRNMTEEVHFTGDNFNGRIDWLAGLYYLDQKQRQRFYRWGMWEFAVPNTGPTDPAIDMAAVNYVRAYGRLMDTNPLCYRPRPAQGQPPLSPPDPDSCLQNFFPLTSISSDDLTENQLTDTAFFGEVTISATDKLDLTVGVRLTQHDGRAITLRPTAAFRTADPLVSPEGDSFAGVVTAVNEDPDLGTITTNKYGITYQATDAVMAYATYSEGFTSGGVTISPNFPNPIILDPEVISTYEVGIKSDLLGSRLRFNADYYDFKWTGLRVPILPDDPANPGQKLPFPVNTSAGRAAGDGWEFDLTWAPGERWRINGGLGLTNNRYLFIGVPDPTGVNGLQPGLPFAYSPDESASVALQYDMPLGNGGHIVWNGRYGWMGKYIRDPANQRIPKDANGNIIFEPSYGIFNANVRYEPSDRDWYVEVWGRNLGDVQYVNGGFDARTVWGYDFSTIGRKREFGAAIGFEF
jgi:iron complex outermembrane receptor protein